MRRKRRGSALVSTSGTNRDGIYAVSTRGQIGEVQIFRYADIQKMGKDTKKAAHKTAFY